LKVIQGISNVTVDDFLSDENTAFAFCDAAVTVVDDGFDGGDEIPVNCNITKIATATETTARRRLQTSSPGISLSYTLTLTVPVGLNADVIAASSQALLVNAVNNGSFDTTLQNQLADYGVTSLPSISSNSISASVVVIVFTAMPSAKPTTATPTRSPTSLLATDKTTAYPQTSSFIVLWVMVGIFVATVTALCALYFYRRLERLAKDDELAIKQDDDKSQSDDDGGYYYHQQREADFCDLLRSASLCIRQCFKRYVNCFKILLRMADYVSVQ
jgi:hypothetical protein